MTDPTNPRVFLTVEEVAALLRVCRTTVCALIGRSRARPTEPGFPHTKVGSTYRIRCNELDAWLEAGCPMPDDALPEAS